METPKLRAKKPYLTRIIYATLGTKSSRVKVVIWEPSRQKGGSFRCRYQIVGIGDEKIRFGTGVDRIQALQITFSMIGSDLSLRQPEARYEFSDLKSHGFPIPQL